MAIDTRNCFWFGTEERSSWFATPLQGADSSPSAWGADGTLLNGGGWGLHSWGSHKRYTYEWPASSSREVAQKMKSYRDGTYGRGLLYFLEPTIFSTNVLPAHWADPSMALDNEAPSLVYGVDPSPLPTSGGAGLGLPVTSAHYDLSGTPYQSMPTPDSSVFIPIPTGHTLFLGAFYSATGDAGVYATPVNANGTLGAAVKLTEKSNSDTEVVTDQFSGNIRGVRLWVGRSGSTSSSVTIAAMIGRLIKSSEVPVYGPWEEQRRNLFTNPSFAAGSGTVEVARNLFTNPSFAGGSGEVRVPRGGVISDADPDFVIDGTDMVGVPVAGMSANNCLVVRSSKFGGSMRLIPTMASNNSYAEMVPRQQPSSDVTRTAIATIHLESSLTGALHGQALSLRTILPDGYTAGPNTAGSREIRRNFTWSSSGTSGRLLFMHGGAQGSGDVYWTLPGLFEGDYDGPWFDGSYSPDPDLTASWTGAVNASASVLTGVPVAGVTADNCLAIRSSRWAKEGTRSLRIITTGAGPFATIPASAGQHTALVTAHLEAPLPVVGGIFPSLSNGTETDPVPNVAGDHDLRITGDPNPGLHAFVLTGGPSVGDSVWYDCAGLFEGTYDGPWFDGNSEGTDTERYRWAGAENDSESIYETRTRTGSPAALDKLTKGPWIGGQGHSGCRFLGTPTYVTNSPINGGRIGFAASFIEVGSWVYG